MVRKRHVRVRLGAGNYEIWLYDGGRPIRRGPLVDRALAVDALKFGQDLVEDRIEDFLRELERFAL